MRPARLPDVLDQAQQRFNDARKAMQQAEAQAERARAEVTRAKAAVSAHGDVARRVAEWEASQPGELPPHLAQARRRLAASQEEHEQTERMLATLEREAQQLRHAANIAGTELRAAVTEAISAAGEQSPRKTVSARPPGQALSTTFAAEFAHLRAAISPELPDWNEIRLVFRMLEPHATAPEMHEALEDLMTAPDRASLVLAANRLEVAFGRAGGPGRS